MKLSFNLARYFGVGLVTVDAQTVTAVVNKIVVAAKAGLLRVILVGKIHGEHRREQDRTLSNRFQHQVDAG